MSCDASELADAAIKKEQCSLLGVKGQRDAFENLPGCFGEIVVRRCHRSHVGNGPQHGEEADKLRVLFHHRRSDGTVRATKT